MRRDLSSRIARIERERGLTAEQRSFMDRMKRFQAVLAAYEAERERIAGALPPGWRLVTDFLIRDGGVVSKRHRATNQPRDIDDGWNVDQTSRRVIEVRVLHGTGYARPWSEDEAKRQEVIWQAEQREVPEDLRRAIRALEPVDWIDYFNGKQF
jgi:hypothetical protein